MAIITAEELRRRFGAEIDRLADHSGDNAPEEDVIKAAIDDAEDEVRAIIGPAVADSLPEPPPALLKQLAAVVARYNLCRRDVEPDHPAYIAYRDALKQLDGIARGRIELSLKPEATVPPVAVKPFDPLITDEALAPMLPGRTT